MTLRCRRCPESRRFSPHPHFDIPLVGVLYNARPSGWRHGPIDSELVTLCGTCYRLAVTLRRGPPSTNPKQAQKNAANTRRRQAKANKERIRLRHPLPPNDPGGRGSLCATGHPPHVCMRF